MIRSAISTAPYRTAATPAGRQAEAAPNRVAACSAMFFAALLIGGCSKAPPEGVSPPGISSSTSGRAWFEESGARAGLTFHHSSGSSGRFWIPEMMSGGVGLLDFDRDGDLDIYCVNAGSLDPAVTNRPGNMLFRNLGNWKFEEVTESAGVKGRGDYGMGCACADFDSDGFIDLLVTNLGRNILYRNNGDGSFTDVSERAGVTNSSWGTSAAFFDYDADGYLDLVIANYLNWSPEREIECYSRGGLRDYCSPMNYKSPAIDTLYHNRGDGTFENVTAEAGLTQAFGNGLGVVCADFNQDGRLDIFVANDAMPNQLWINQRDGRFKDEAMIRGCAVNLLGIPEAGMGVVAVDLHQRGSLDLFVTHLEGEGNRLFANANGVFTDTVTPRGPGAISLPYTGFGVAFADFDNDGHLDLYVANGKVKHGQRQFDSADRYAEPNNLLRGLGDGAFEEILPAGGTHEPLIATSRGLAAGDLDNDGAIDLVVINRDGPAHLLRNRAGVGAQWVLLSVVDYRGAQAINAQVRIEAGGRRYWRQVLPNQGYCSSNDPRIHCGLGSATNVESITVVWIDGVEEEFGPYAACKVYEIRRGAGRKRMDR